MNLRELFFYAVKRGNCYVLPALRFIKLICKMQNVTEQYYLSLLFSSFFSFAVIAIACTSSFCLMVRRLILRVIRN